MSTTSERITTMLWYDAGQAEEAAKFYCSVFKRSKLGKIARYPKGSPGREGSVMTVEFELEGRTFVALNGGPQPTSVFNDAVSFVVNCKDQKELDLYWDKLLAGGGKPVACGWLQDRFGLRWQVTPANWERFWTGKDPKAAERVMQAMMKMVKLDIPTLEAAAAGTAPKRRKAA